MKTLALLVVALSIVTSAYATNAAQPLQLVPNSNPLQFTGSLTYYGVTTYRVESSTPTATPVLLGSGSGFLYGVECSSGASGDSGLALDSASASGLTNLSQGKALSPFVYSSAATANAAQATLGQWIPAGGSKRFVNGLAFIKTNSGSSFTCLVSALFDSVIASGSH